MDAVIVNSTQDVRSGEDLGITNICLDPLSFKKLFYVYSFLWGFCRYD